MERYHWRLVLLKGGGSKWGRLRGQDYLCERASWKKFWALFYAFIMFLTIKLLQFTLLTGYLINQLNDCVMDVGWYSNNAIMGQCLHDSWYHKAHQINNNKTFMVSCHVSRAIKGTCIKIQDLQHKQDNTDCIPHTNWYAIMQMSLRIVLSTQGLPSLQITQLI